MRVPAPCFRISKWQQKNAHFINNVLCMQKKTWTWKKTVLLPRHQRQFQWNACLPEVLLAFYRWIHRSIWMFHVTLTFYGIFQFNLIHQIEKFNLSNGKQMNCPGGIAQRNNAVVSVFVCKFQHNKKNWQRWLVVAQIHLTLHFARMLNMCSQIRQLRHVTLVYPLVARRISASNMLHRWNS